MWFCKNYQISNRNFEEKREKSFFKKSHSSIKTFQDFGKTNQENLVEKKQSKQSEKSLEICITRTTKLEKKKLNSFILIFSSIIFLMFTETFFNFRNNKTTYREFSESGFFINIRLVL